MLLVYFILNTNAQLLKY